MCHCTYSTTELFMGHSNGECLHSLPNLDELVCLAGDRFLRVHYTHGTRHVLMCLQENFDG